MPTQKILLLACAALLAGCSSERHFARDSWPLGNPNRPPAASETAQISLGHRPVVEALAPQAGSVWPGAVQPVPTIAEEQKAMNQPLGSALAALALPARRGTAGQPGPGRRSARPARHPKFCPPR